MNEKDMKNNSNTINEDSVVKAEYLRIMDQLWIESNLPGWVRSSLNYT